jgi:prefoldin subunit 5
LEEKDNIFSYFKKNSDYKIEFLKKEQNNLKNELKIIQTEIDVNKNNISNLKNELKTFDQFLKKKDLNSNIVPSIFEDFL